MAMNSCENLLPGSQCSVTTVEEDASSEKTSVSSWADIQIICIGVRSLLPSLPQHLTGLQFVVCAHRVECPGIFEGLSSVRVLNNSVSLKGKSSAVLCASFGTPEACGHKALQTVTEVAADQAGVPYAPMAAC